MPMTPRQAGYGSVVFVHDNRNPQALYPLLGEFEHRAREKLSKRPPRVVVEQLYNSGSGRDVSE